MDKEQEVGPPDKDNVSTASLAPRRASILSGEWISLPTLSVPEDTRIFENAEEQQQRQSSSTKGIDNNERRKTIDRMRSALTRGTATTLVRSASEADSTRDRDIALFHEVYSVCFEDAQPLISLLKEEMLVQMLEDFGEHLSGKNTLSNTVSPEACHGEVL